MTYAQLTVRTEDGKQKMQSELRTRSRKFKNVELKDLEATLYDNRVTYSPHGQAAAETRRRKDDAWKAKSWQFTEAGLRKHGAMAKSSTTLRDVRKAYQKAMGAGANL